jgi:hypothetical protein
MTLQRFQEHLDHSLFVKIDIHAIPFHNEQNVTREWIKELTQSFSTIISELIKSLHSEVVTSKEETNLQAESSITNLFANSYTSCNQVLLMGIPSSYMSKEHKLTLVEDLKILEQTICVSLHPNYYQDEFDFTTIQVLQGTTFPEHLAINVIISTPCRVSDAIGNRMYLFIGNVPYTSDNQVSTNGTGNRYCAYLHDCEDIQHLRTILYVRGATYKTSSFSPRVANLKKHLMDNGVYDYYILPIVYRHLPTRQASGKSKGRNEILIIICLLNQPSNIIAEFKTTDILTKLWIPPNTTTFHRIYQIPYIFTTNREHVRTPPITTLLNHMYSSINCAQIVGFTDALTIEQSLQYIHLLFDPSNIISIFGGSKVGAYNGYMLILNSQYVQSNNLVNIMSRYQQQYQTTLRILPRETFEDYTRDLIYDHTNTLNTTRNQAQTQLTTRDNKTQNSSSISFQTIQAEISKEIEKHLRPLRMEANNIKAQQQFQIDEIRTKQDEIQTKMDTYKTTNESLLMSMQEENRKLFSEQKAGIDVLLQYIHKLAEADPKRKKSASPHLMTTDEL